MECLSDKPQHQQQEQNHRMALSYMQEAQITAGLLANQSLNMKQEPGVPSEKPHHMNHATGATQSFNNSTSSATATTLFSGVYSAAAASLSMLSPEQLLAASHMGHALMAAGINPVSLAAANSFRHQALFGAWAPSSANSPPSPLQPGPVSPALSAKSSQSQSSRGRTPSNGITTGQMANMHNNNNNIVSSSADRLGKKAVQQNVNGQAKKRSSSKVGKTEGAVTIANNTEGQVASPPSQSVSPDQGAGTKTETREKSFVCNICSRSFGYKHVLQNHERTHTGEKPFKCPTCSKKFTRDHHLKTHMRLHTGEKPYECTHCDRKFVQVANLRRHLRVHTGERPYVCELCTAKFSDSNQLKAHLLIHKNEKPFKCEHCEMRFRRRHHLVHHKCGGVGNNTTTILPGNLVTTQLGTSPSLASDDLEDERELDADIVMGDELMLNKRKQTLKRNAPPMRQLTSPTVLPLNLGIPLDLPEQTEPEDLSMTRMRHEDDYESLHRPHSQSHSSGGGSPMSHSPSSDPCHEDEEEDEEEDLDVARASPSSLFAPDSRRVR